MSWIEKLKSRWDLRSTYQVVIVLIVFALTGTTVLLIKQPIISLFQPGDPTTLSRIVYFLFILPIYNVILLAYGFIFGQFSFFWNFEKRTFSRIKKLFVHNK